MWHKMIGSGNAVWSGASGHVWASSRQANVSLWLLLTRACLFHSLLAACCALAVGCSNSASTPRSPAGAGAGDAGTLENDPATNGHSSASGKHASPDVAADFDTTRETDWFEDVTSTSGVDFSYRNGRAENRYFFLESLGGGVALFDFDHDGDIDLFATGGGTFQGEPVRPVGYPPVLYRNEGNWTFTAVTAHAGLAVSDDYSHGCAAGDFNRDGFTDLLVCCYGRSRLWRNQGDGTFTECTTAAQLAATGWCTSAVIADADRDGLPDLFFTRYIDWSVETDLVCTSPAGVRDLCGPGQYPGTNSLFFRNRGDGTFADMTRDYEINGNVKGLGVVAFDANADGLVDFYLANDETPNHLYLGRPSGGFDESGEIAGVAFSDYGESEGSMGIDVADYDGDGRPDLWVSNFELEDNSLYRNRGNGIFVHSTVAVGLAGRSRMRVGFGTAMVDFDHDAWPDIFVTNGNAIYVNGRTPFRQVPQLFQNRDGSRFVEVTADGGTYFRTRHAGRGSAAADLDDDGALDLVVSHLNEPLSILRNRRRPQSHLTVRLLGTHSDPDAIGARVTWAFQGRTVARFVVRGSGYFSHADERLILVIEPENQAIDVAVDWPGRGREVFPRRAARRFHLLVEGEGVPHGER
jgi:hypothetical protein